MKYPAQLGALSTAGALCFFAWAYAARTAAAQAGAAHAPTDAAALYDKKCATCHGKDGRAKTFKARFKPVRDLTDAAWQAEVSDERLFNSITAGRGKMPAFGKKLSKEQIESLVAYVRGLKK